MTTGIICEYNPMHRGHEEMIKKLRAGGTDTVVCLMSGSFVQRGEPAIADKYGRAAAAVRSGADVVLELPFPWSCGSARYFAAAGIYILNALGVKNIAFGSECADAAMLCAAAEAAPEDIRTDTAATGAAAGYFAALNERLGGASRLMPNDILGVEYIRAARVLGTGTDFTVVRREGAGFNDSDPDADIPSASALRTAVREGRLPHGLCDASAEMLRDAAKNGGAPADMSALGSAVLYRFRTAGSAALSEYAECGGGVSGRLCHAAETNGTLADMMAAAATKKYTDARLRRAVIFAMTETRKSDLDALPAYVTLLAVNGRGRKFLSDARRSAALPVLTRPSDARTAESAGARRQSELLLASESLYSLTLPVPRTAGDFMRRSPLCLQNND